MLSVVGKAMHKFVLILLAWAFCSILPIRATDPPTQTFQDRVIQRSNFGALFYAQHQVTVFSDHYLHHLVFQLPHKAITLQLNFMREFTQDLVNTSQNNSSSSLYLIMNQMVKTQTKHIAFLLDTVYSLIPELVYPSDQSRATSRAVCWVCGKLNQWLQGLAMQEDLLALQQIVESSQNLTQSRFESIEKSLSALSSYSQITDSKIDALKVITQQLRVQSMSLLSSVKDQKIHLQLLTALVLLQRPQPVAMQSLTFEQQLNEYLKQKQITTTTAPLIKFPFDFKFQVARDFHIFEFFIFLILLTMCLYFIWCKIRRHQSRHQLELVLELSNRNDSVKISLMKLFHLCS
jgi:hypothetical protein